AIESRSGRAVEEPDPAPGLLLRRLQRPLALEQDERLLLRVVDEHAAVAGREITNRCPIALHPPRGNEGQVAEPRLDPVLVLEPMEEHIELQSADGTDDG